MQWFEWSPLVLLFPSPPVLVSILLVTVTRVQITIVKIVTFMFHIFFLIPLQGRSTYPSFHSLSIFLCGHPRQLSSLFCKFSFLFSFFFFVDYYKIWSSGRDSVIRLYLKIPEEFGRLIFQDRCWFLHIPLVLTVKFQFFAQFPVDHLAHPVVSSLIYFVACFTFYGIFAFYYCHVVSHWDDRNKITTILVFELASHQGMTV